MFHYFLGVRPDCKDVISYYWEITNTEYEDLKKNVEFSKANKLFVKNTNVDEMIGTKTSKICSNYKSFNLMCRYNMAEIYLIHSEDKVSLDDFNIMWKQKSKVFNNAKIGG